MPPYRSEIFLLCRVFLQNDLSKIARSLLPKRLWHLDSSRTFWQEQEGQNRLRKQPHQCFNDHLKCFQCVYAVRTSSARNLDLLGYFGSRVKGKKFWLPPDGDRPQVVRFSPMTNKKSLVSALICKRMVFKGRGQVKSNALIGWKHRCRRLSEK